MAINSTSRIYTTKGLITPKILSDHSNDWAKIFSQEGPRDVYKIITIPPKEKLYRVSTELGNSIIVDGDQKLLMKSAKGFKAVGTSSLSVGDEIFLLLCENPVGVSLESEKIEITNKYKNVDIFNGHFNASIGCFLGFYFGCGRAEEDEISFLLDKSVWGIGFIVNEFFQKEFGHRGVLKSTENPTILQYVLKSKFIVEWLKKNSLFIETKELFPSFLYESTSEIVSAFLLGYLLATKQSLVEKIVFPTEESAINAQLLLFNENIVNQRSGTTIAFPTVRANDEWKQLLSKSKILTHPFPFTMTDRQMDDGFFRTKISSILREPKQETFYLQIEGNAFSANGFYITY
mgnify:CR=1 FL=1